MTASGLTIAAIMGVMLLVFIFSGYYLFAALGGAAIISGLVFWGPNVFQTIYFSIFKYCKDYNLLAACRCLSLMGQLLNQSGVAGRLFDNLSVAPRTTARRYGSRGDAHSNTLCCDHRYCRCVRCVHGAALHKPMLDAKYNKSRLRPAL